MPHATYYNCLDIMALINKNTKKLSKFLDYVLGRNPDEFGLLTDERGFVPVKELLKALGEEEGWRHIRFSNLKEVIATMYPSPIEIEEKRIRARSRSQLPAIGPANDLPKLLYFSLRRRAWPVMFERGWVPRTDTPPIVLAASREMSRRIGLRRDPDPVIVTVQVAASLESGTQFQQYGNHLYLADAVYPGTFSGPPLPKEKPVTTKMSKPAEPEAPKTPGSYFPDFDVPQEPKRRRKEIDWKKDRRKARRHKTRQQR